jgi:hypothetical protein
MAPPAHVSRFLRSFRKPLLIASFSASTAQAERSSVHTLTGPIAAVLALRIIEPLRLLAGFVRRGIAGSLFPKIVLLGTQCLFFAGRTRDCGLP